MFDALIARADSRLLARHWVERLFRAGTTIAQIGPEGSHLFLHDDSEVPYTTIGFSREGIRPDIVVIASSPVIEAPQFGAMDDILRTKYTLAFAIDVDPADRRNVYDLQDEFYVPFAGFHRVERPGPNLKVYVRRGVGTRYN
jgi:hypothetical protein